jgi:hypothetical protein
MNELDLDARLAEFGENQLAIAQPILQKLDFATVSRVPIEQLEGSIAAGSHNRGAWMIELHLGSGEDAADRAASRNMHARKGYVHPAKSGPAARETDGPRLRTHRRSVKKLGQLLKTAQEQRAFPIANSQGDAFFR